MWPDRGRRYLCRLTFEPSGAPTDERLGGLADDATGRPSRPRARVLGLGLSEGLGRTSPEIAVRVCRQVQKRNHRGNDESFQV